MAVKAANDSVDPDGLVTTLLVYETLPHFCLPKDPPSPSTLQRAVVLQKSTESMTRYFASSQICDALSTRNGAYVTYIQKAFVDCPVLVYRPHVNRWDGHYSLLDMNGEDVTVLLPPPSELTKFRTNVVKLFIAENNQPGSVQTNSDRNMTSPFSMQQSNFTKKVKDKTNTTIQHVCVWPSLKAATTSSFWHYPQKTSTALLIAIYSPLSQPLVQTGAVYTTHTSSNPSKMRAHRTPLPNQNLGSWKSMTRNFGGWQVLPLSNAHPNTWFRLCSELNSIFLLLWEIYHKPMLNQKPRSNDQCMYNP